MATSAFPATRSTIGQAQELHVETSRWGSGLLRYPNLTTTVPKELVHRAAVAEVMLTDWERVDETRFKVAAQWPRSHSFFTPVDGRFHDPLIAAETIRQVGSLLGHAEFGVPFGHHYLLHDLSLRVHPEHMMIHQAPASLELEVTCRDIKMRGGRLAALRYETAVRRDGHVAATGLYSFSCVSPAVYRRVRPEHVFSSDHRPLPLTAPAAPQSVGRMSPADVVLSPIGEPNRWQLRLDTQHPVLFDHPGDHVPGMVLLEAARQAAAGVLGRSSLFPLGITSELLQYAELDIPCVIEANPLPPQADGHLAVHVTGHQQGGLVFSCTVTAAARTD
ncbi:ScbA/BarX family gamma-butyrolactone biosynthesis protein [Streptomyces lancefieldiae]|uniref:ScbA/BarX family gamma-butyrolactone biosynthesis protein n=1 Tax=Streptomyces lancefieldiae TaxID=3075520 RepID=A0ABU3ARY8_9ACTN|nr:ScbA/BarX family gamma-butyrolactone biosynthesis protein [Streptomyces sp. DSM 40712]MDT0612749.1 ScbA/BarX family gamma-butyrolactone biosynthesis protein [Streptomyces sp. DSM 40712]